MGEADDVNGMGDCALDCFVRGEYWSDDSWSEGKNSIHRKTGNSHTKKELENEIAQRLWEEEKIYPLPAYILEGI
ncbi:hypothetical protein [Planococcus donghaensis]|uniref:hypothetical protein n=1 Tax=Planococcus donghaensis TaxID=414778 RepID=UPI003735CBB8